MTNITGTVTVDNCSIISSPHNGVTVDNNNTNMAGFNFTNTTISCGSGQPCQPSGSIGNDGLLLVMRGNSVLTSGLISGSTFSGVRAVGVQIQTNDTGRIGANSGGAINPPAASNSITVQSNTFTGNGQGIDVDSSQVSNLTFQVVSNTIVGKLTAPGAISSQASAVAINAFTSAGADTGPTVHTFVGKIDGNIIGTQGVKDSGAGFGSGIRAVVQGTATQGVISITNNTIRETPNADIITAIGQNGAASSPSASARFKITGNIMPQPSGSNLSLCGPPNTACASNGIFVLADEGSPVCNVITGNNIYDVSTMNGSFDIYLAERAGPPAGAQLTVEGTSGSNLVYILANNTLAGAAKFIDEGGNTSQVGLGACGTFPSAPTGGEAVSAQDQAQSDRIVEETNAPGDKTGTFQKGEILSEGMSDDTPNSSAVVRPLLEDKIRRPTIFSWPREFSGSKLISEPNLFSQAVFRNAGTVSTIAPYSNAKSASYSIATVTQKTSPSVPQTTVTQNIGALPAGKSVTIKFAVTVNNPPAAAQVSTQGTVSATGISNVLTDDPDTGAASDPTVTLIDLTITWAGGTSTNWDTGANWNTTFAPIAINDVNIPAAGVTNEPTISASSPTINSLTIAIGRTLTITGQTLNIAGNWTNNGALAGNGTVVFNGNGNTQTLAGSTTFNNLTINHTGAGNVTAHSSRHLHQQ